MIRGIIILMVYVLSIAVVPARAQTQRVAIKDIISSIDTFSSKLTPEKLYIQFDKPYYAIADTIWFKAYLFDASFLTASPKSGVVYIELANDTNKVLLRRMLRVYSGLGSGNIALPKDEVPEGSYTIRAYTSLMRNFGEDRIFKKTFYVSGLTNQSWLVSANSILADSAGKANIRLGLKLTKLDKSAVGLKDLQLRVMDGRRNILRDNVQTDALGMLDINFNLPEKADKISVIAEEDLPTYALMNKSKEVKPVKVVIPIPVNRPENTDLQFMPEGGNMVAGIAGKIGFKAIGEDGKGTDVSGMVYNTNNEQVAEFKSTHKGMGSFYLNPQQGETYTAKIILSNGTIKNYPLPKVQTSGTTLDIRNSMQSDSLEISVSVPQNATSFYLIGQYGAVVCYAATIRNSIRMKAAKKLFSTGIAHFTLLNADKKAVNERIVYIDHHDQLNISVIPNKTSYKTRDSISLAIEVKDKEGEPVQGSFSVAVTDDSQVKTDSTTNLQTNILLTSDLKGTIEEPNYYFINTNESWEAMDNLMLTQGWVGYDWKETFDPKEKPVFEAEKEFMVKGKVSNIFNKSLGEVKVVMISTKPLFVKDTVTDNNGRFVFKDFPHLDSVAFRLQATNKKDKSNNVGIEAEEFKPPVFERNLYQIMPWYMNTDATLLNYVKSTITQKEEEFKFSGKDNVLSTVTITAKKVVKGSWNLNGPGSADITLDENDAKKAGKINLADLLDKKIPGFYQGNGYLPGIGSTMLYNILWHGKRDIIFIIDGMAIKSFGFLPKEMLEYFTAEDIRGIELTYPGNKGWTYCMHYSLDLETRPDLLTDNIWVEITTRSGNGPLTIPVPGTYLFKPMPFAETKQFYNPRYTVKNKPAILEDLRSTIHWQPDVITNSEGKAMMSFYSSDRAGTYTLTAEGSDMNGKIGSKTEKIIIKP